MATPRSDRRGDAETDEPREALDQLVAALVVVLAYAVWETAP